MPKREPGVYRSESGGWFWKANNGADPATGAARQVLRRGYKTAGEAATARRESLVDRDAGRLATAAKGLTIRDLGVE